MASPKEVDLEDLVFAWLTEHGGYVLGKNDKDTSGTRDFDVATGLDTAELFAFIGQTQPDEWAKLIAAYGGDAAASQLGFAVRLASELDKRGVVDVLRAGVVDRGVTIKLVYFKPAFGFVPEVMARYEKNRLTVTRQLRYEASGKSLDLALLVNGIVVATAELKNPLSGQSIEHAMQQYRTDRDPKNRTLARAVVHFAVDPERVEMTTRLAGSATDFLPFNRGYGFGAGNPPNPGGITTAYLWEQVWQADAWLDILGRFVHSEKPARGSKRQPTVIFPRYHQWDCVRRLEAAASDEGPGHDYLVQHSAGSGKSNTIAWLAHRLSTLHANDEKVFDKVVVITDRVVLNRQLQDTVFQFEQVHGVVERIEQGSTQLAAALEGERARIIVTTLQTFPFLLGKVEQLPDRRYAVLIDEAHSSQTGEAAKELRRVLGAKGDGDLEPEDVEELLVEAVRARGKQPNLSFFAFTATPKGKTLERFGRFDPEAERYEPFHVYSMRQAIEERFIHDVLANYTTYESFYRLEKAVEDDPRYETAKARRAIARFVTLHEVNLAQKAEIVVRHFTEHVAHKVGGRAKAMVVTTSREHAVRFWQALRSYSDEHGVDCNALVAFSGTVTIDGVELTEAKCNGVPESQTAGHFEEDDQRIMVVAEKFQTGFDQPKLYAMYVDKTLTGLAAVQTLSRLNRIHPDKDGTFVLDFVNDAHQVAAEFQQWHVQTVAPASDPNLLYDTRQALDEYDVLRVEESTTLAGLLLATGTDTARVHATLKPAIDRFHELEEGEQDAFRDALGRFVRIYSFLSQVVSFTDTALERDYLFARALASFIRKDVGDSVDLSEEVELTHLRHEQRFAGSVSLEDSTGEVQTVFSGTGKLRDPQEVALSELIAALNEAFGTNWQDVDRVYRAVAGDLMADVDVQHTAVNNTPENFGVVFKGIFEKGLLGFEDKSNAAIYQFFDNEGLAETLLPKLATLVQAGARVAYQEHCPIGELLGTDLESSSLEYKSTLRTHVDTGAVFEPLQTASLKTVAAFANSRMGGTLLIGVADDGTIVGLERDYASLRKTGKDDRDLFQLHLTNVLVASMGETVAANVSVQVHSVDGKDVCRVHVRPSSFPVDAKVTVEKKGQMEKKVAFYVRLANGTRELTDPDERQRYVADRWS
jgi:type I restriction enzyme R subunit